MIKKLENNLGKKPSPSPFDNLRSKYGAAKPKGSSPKEEEKIPAKKNEQKNDKKE